VPAKVARQVLEVFAGRKAADLALFGRMVAEKTDLNIDAACQVAHAISTNKATMEVDFFTAVDDLPQEGRADAGMLGSVEFNSSCFYRYASLHVGKLVENLQDDALARKSVEAFLTAFIHAIPTGKQNTFAAHNPPSMVFAVVRDGQPLSLANAFVKPISPGRDENLVALSIAALDDYHGRMVGMYGNGGTMAHCQLDSVPVTHLGTDVGSVQKLIATVTAAAFPGGAA